MPPSNNALLIRSLATRADQLGCAAAGDEFPVILRPIAERRRVTSIDFCPLLVDAMLTTHAGGFRILFNSNDSVPSNLNQRFSAESKDNLMPPRLRFSLAHELAHTLFYELGDGPPKVAKGFRSGGGRTALEHLEQHCNSLAGHLLLPTPMLEKAFASLKAIEPEPLLLLAQRAGVSVEALVRRLAKQNSIFQSQYFRGCIVLLRRLPDKTVIRAIAKPPSSMNIARELRQMRSGEAWQFTSADGHPLEPDILPAKSSAKLLLETGGGANVIAEYQIGTSNIGSFAEATSYLLTLEQLGM